MKLINIANTLLTRGAARGHHVPLIRFPDRRAPKQTQHQQPQIKTASAPQQSPKLNKNAVYIDFTKAPKRLPMRNDEMDLVMSGGAN